MNVHPGDLVQLFRNVPNAAGRRVSWMRVLSVLAVFTDSLAVT